MPLISDFPTNDRIIDGKDMMDDAKMIGITPAVFTFSGILDDCPPTIFLPYHFLGILYRNSSLSAIQDQYQHNNSDDHNSDDNPHQQTTRDGFAFYEGFCKGLPYPAGFWKGC